MKPITVQRIFHYLHFIFLPLALAFLFAIQNQIFNDWLDLIANQYSSRLLFSSFALGLILYSPALFFKKRGSYVYLFFISCFISFIFLGQFIYFKYGQSFVQVSALRYFGQTFAITGTIIDLLSFGLLIFVSNIFLVVVAFVLSYKNAISSKILKHKDWQQSDIVFSGIEKIALFFIILVVSFSGYTFLIKEEKIEWGNASRLYADVYDLNTLVEKIGIVNFTFEDALKYVSKSNLVTQQDRDFLQTYAKNSIKPATLTPALVSSKAPQQKPNYFGVDKNKNIIFIQIESLENAVINQTIGGQQITPNLNKLAAQGLYFSHYYTQVGPGNTADAEFSILNSLYPLSDDVAFVDYAQNNYQALPATLVKNKYHTYALHGDVPTFWNRSNIYPNLGYQDQISEGDYLMSRPVGKGPSPLGDEDFLSQSIPKMETFKQPFMATLITLSSHTPFELPKDLQTLQIPANTNLTYTQQQYLESLHYMDAALGEFMDKLQQEDFYKNSVILIYGDHQSYTDISQALNIGDQNLPALSGSQVPLILLNSGAGIGQSELPASHIDLYPTLLNLLGLKAMPGIFGQDIFNTKTPVVTRRNIFSGSINTILTDTLAFKENSDGDFENGTCLQIPQEILLPVDDCKDIYTQQVDTVRASDIIVRGNLLNYYVSDLPK